MPRRACTDSSIREGQIVQPTRRTRGRMGIWPAPGPESVVQPLVPGVELFPGSSPGLIQMMKDLNRAAAL